MTKKIIKRCFAGFLMLSLLFTGIPFNEANVKAATTSNIYDFKDELEYVFGDPIEISLTVLNSGKFYYNVYYIPYDGTGKKKVVKFTNPNMTFNTFASKFGFKSKSFTSSTYTVTKAENTAIAAIAGLGMAFLTKDLRWGVGWAVGFSSDALVQKLLKSPGKYRKKYTRCEFRYDRAYGMKDYAYISYLTDYTLQKYEGNKWVDVDKYEAGADPFCEGEHYDPLVW